MRKKSVQVPILIGFGLILLILATVLVINLSQMQQFSQHIRSVVLEQNRKSDLAAIMNELQRNRYRSLLHASALSDPFERDEELRHYHDLAKEFIQARDDFLSLPLDDGEMSTWETIRRNVKHVEAEAGIVLDHLSADRQELARRLIKTRLSPVHERMMAGWNQLLYVQSEKNKAAIGEAGRLEVELTRISLVLGAAAFLVGIIVAYVALRISRRMEDDLLEEKDRAQVTLDSISEAVIRINGQGQLCFLNPFAEHLLGMRLDETTACQPESALQLLDKWSREPLTATILEDLRMGRRVALPASACLISAEGMEYDVEGSGAPLKIHGRITGAVLILRDVTESREALRRKAQCNGVDPNTGLSDTSLLESILMGTLRGKRADDQPLAFLLLRMPDLANIRRDLGLNAQGALVQHLINLLRAQIRESDVLVSVDENSLGIVLYACPSAQAQAVADKIKANLQHFQFVWDGQPRAVTLNLGMILIPPFKGTLKECIEAASHASALR